MRLYNIDYIPGKEIEAIDLVRGTVVTSKNIGKDIGAGLNGPFGFDSPRRIQNT